MENQNNNSCNPCGDLLGDIKDIKSHIAEISKAQTAQALSMKGIEIHSETNIAVTKECRVETKKNTSDIAAMKTKQKILTWIGGTTLISVLVATIKYLAKHIH